MFPQVIIFLLFFVEALGNCPVCPPLNPALTLGAESHFRRCKRSKQADGYA